MLKDLFEAPVDKIFAFAWMLFAAACPGMLLIAMFKPDLFDRTDFMKLLMLSLSISVPFIASSYLALLAQLPLWLRQELDNLRVATTCGIFGMLALYVVIVLKVWIPRLDSRAALTIAVPVHLIVVSAIALAIRREEKPTAPEPTGSVPQEK